MYGLGYCRVIKLLSPMENQMDKLMENTWEPGEYGDSRVPSLRITTHDCSDSNSCYDGGFDEAHRFRYCEL